VINQEGNVKRTWIFGVIVNTIEVMFFKNLNIFYSSRLFWCADMNEKKNYFDAFLSIKYFKKQYFLYF
jgi:hypothetical protein